MSKHKAPTAASPPQDGSACCFATPDATLSMDVWVSRRKRVHIIYSLDGSIVISRTYLEDALRDAFEAGLTVLSIDGMTDGYRITLSDLNTS